MERGATTHINLGDGIETIVSCYYTTKGTRHFELRTNMSLPKFNEKGGNFARSRR